jgi:hypothetical protein
VRSGKRELAALTNLVSSSKRKEITMKDAFSEWTARLTLLLGGIVPYAATALLLPGGSLIALIVWVCRHRRDLGSRFREHLAPAVSVTTAAVPKKRRLLPPMPSVGKTSLVDSRRNSSTWLSEKRTADKRQSELRADAELGDRFRRAKRIGTVRSDEREPTAFNNLKSSPITLHLIDETCAQPLRNDYMNTILKTLDTPALSIIRDLADEGAWCVLMRSTHTRRSSP